jgi:5-formyltetrahydrofolate cyclo-ligase
VSAAEEKKALRAWMLQERKAIPAALKAEWDKLICGRIQRSAAFIEAQTILTYMPLGSEVGVLDLTLSALSIGKTVALPLCLANGRLALKRVTDLSAQLRAGHYGILEPMDCLENVSPDRIDFAVIPGVLFDKGGFRIGFGMGYYDRLMESLRADCVKCAAAYSCQIRPDLPRENHDRAVNRIVTENGEIICQGSELSDV